MKNRYDVMVEMEMEELNRKRRCQTRHKYKDR